MDQCKIIVVGPKRSGKTVLSNFFAEIDSNLGGKTDEYEPTVGTRILEFEKDVLPGSGTLAVELWDCSGDRNYERTWRAMKQDANGIVCVYNPDEPLQEAEIGRYFEVFSEGLNVSQQVLCIALQLHTGPPNRIRPPNKINHLQVISSSLDSETLLNRTFDDFLRSVFENKLQLDG